LFQPEIIAKSRKNTSTFSVAGRAVTQIGGAPLGVGKGVFHVGQGVASGVTSGLTGVFGGKKEKDVPAVPALPSGQASNPVGEPAVATNGSSFPTMTQDASASAATGNPSHSGPSEPGTLRVTILSAKDLSMSDVKPYVTLRLGAQEFKTKHQKSAAPEWNESFSFPAGAMTPKLLVWVYDHKTIGKDKVLGEGEIDIWRAIQAGTNPSADVRVELVEGQGQLSVRLEFDSTPTSNSLGKGSSSSSINRTTTMSSPSRFSIRGRRPGTTETDD